MKTSCYVGTAAWAIPKEARDHFVMSGSILESYSQQLNAVEINTSFYRHHQAKTYERWAQSVPENFRFSVKLSKTLTHEKRLEVSTEDIEAAVVPILSLGLKLGCALVQLPPSLEFIEKTAASFFRQLREHIQAPIAFEPRHPSWNSGAAINILNIYKVSRVIADPEPFVGANSISMNLKSEEIETILYLRLHGSPKIYESSYDESRLAEYGKLIAEAIAQRRATWCIFDNTKFGHATFDALKLMRSFLKD